MEKTPHKLPQDAAVINVGLSLFAEAIRDQGAAVTHVDWRVPSGNSPVLLRALTDSYAMKSLEYDKANVEATRRIDRGVPMLIGVAAAQDALPSLPDRTLLHAGPPIEYEFVCDPVRRSMRAATIAEGWAQDVETADRLLTEGSVTLAAANDHATVVPMASAIGPTTPVWMAENTESGTVGFAPVNQGPGDVPWFGRESPAAIERLIFLREVAQPRISQILKESGPIDIMSLASQGVQMGDDVHMRTQATTNLLVRDLLTSIVRLGNDEASVAFAHYLSKNHLFFLTIAMAAAKSLMLAAEQVPGSTIVTTMARNGTTFGVKVGDSPRWYICPAPPVADALYYAGFSSKDAALDMGDSAVLELIGLGGAAAAGSPAVAAFLGGSMSDAARATEDMRRICVQESSRFKLPTMGFRGTPLGVDVRKVVETGISPKVTTGILHHSSGAGQIGAGVATAPLEGFEQALVDLVTRGEGVE